MLPPDCEWAEADAAFVRKVVSFVRSVLAPAVAASALEKEEVDGACAEACISADVDQVLGGITHPMWGGDGWHRWSGADRKGGAEHTEDNWCRLILPGGIGRFQVEAARNSVPAHGGAAQVDTTVEAESESQQALPAVLFLGTKRSVSLASLMDVSTLSLAQP